MSARLPWLLPALFLFIGCGSPEVTVVSPLAAVNWSPHDGASGIELGSEPSVCLSLEIDEGTLSHASLRSGDTDPGKVPQTVVDSEVALSSLDGACVVFRGSNLEAGTTYHMVLEPGLASQDGVVLESVLSARFRTVED